MHQGKLNGYFAQGFNPLAAFPTRPKIGEALAKLKFPGGGSTHLATETSEFWKNFGESTMLEPSKIQTEVFRLLPPLCGGGRFLWQLKPCTAMAIIRGLTPPGEAQGAMPEIIAGLFPSNCER